MDLMNSSDANGNGKGKSNLPAGRKKGREERR